jgi:hypothetical protein
MKPFSSDSSDILDKFFYSEEAKGSKGLDNCEEYNGTGESDRPFCFGNSDLSDLFNLCSVPDC